MSYAFPDIDPNTTGQIYNVPVPLSRYLDASFDMGQEATVLNSANRISEMSFAESEQDSPILDTKTANERWGMGTLKFEEPVRESVARVMNRRKRDEMDREFFLNQGGSAGRFIPGMAASILGAVANPLDLGLMFVPFVGEEAAVAKATTIGGRVLARKLVTREVLQEIIPQAPRLTEAVINGVVGQTLFEIPNIVASAQDQANYGPSQAAFNILTAGGFSAGLHGAGMLLQKLGRGTREEMARQALNQWVRDETVQVHQYVKVDEAAILEKLKFDADAARSAAYDAINMDDIAEAVRQTYGEVVESPAIRTPDGSIFTGPSHADALDSGVYRKLDGYQEQLTALGYTYEAEVWFNGKMTGGWNITEKSPAAHQQLLKDYKDLQEAADGIADGQGSFNDIEGFVTDKGRFISRDEAGKLVGLPDKGYNHSMHQNDKLMSEQISTSNPEELGAAEFDRYNQLIEENPHLNKTDALKQIMKERGPRRDRYLMEQPEILKLVEEERVKAIAKFIEDERVKFEQQKQGKFDAMKQAEIDRQIAEGKVLKPDEIQKATPAREHDGSQDADLDFDIEGLKQDLKLEEDGVKPDNSGKTDPDGGMIATLEKLIKSLDHDPTKMSLPLADLLTLGIGRPVLKGLLIAVKEGLVLFNDLTKAIDHAMEWFAKQEKTKRPQNPALVEKYRKHLTDNVVKYNPDALKGKSVDWWVDKQFSEEFPAGRLVEEQERIDDSLANLLEAPGDWPILDSKGKPANGWEDMDADKTMAAMKSLFRNIVTKVKTGLAGLDLKDPLLGNDFNSRFAMALREHEVKNGGIPAGMSELVQRQIELDTRTRRHSEIRTKLEQALKEGRFEKAQGPEPMKPHLEAIETAVDCILKKLI